MNEQLQNALATILGKTVEGIDAGVAFMQSELPDVISQLLLWYGVKSFILFFFATVILISIPVAWVKWVGYCNREDNCYTDEFEKLVIPAMVSLVPILISSFMMNIEWIQIWIAPKIWLIEYASQLAK